MKVSVENILSSCRSKELQLFKSLNNTVFHFLKAPLYKYYF